MEQTEKIFKIFADKNRIRILKLLEQRKMCVCELAFILKVTQPSISRHLKKMKKAGLVSDERDKFWTNYYLVKDSAHGKALMNCLKKWLVKDTTVQSDLARMKIVNRTRLCCQ